MRNLFGRNWGLKTFATGVAACLLAIGLTPARSQAQAPATPEPHNLVRLQARASVDVAQDLLTLRLSTSRDGIDASVVQSQLKQALELALAEARKSVQPGQLEVHSGNFSLFPRRGRDGRISSWQGTTELVLEGRDFAGIAAAAGTIESLTVSSVEFGLSREQRSKVEAQSQSLAIERFKGKAAEIAKGFGFSGYTLREVAVQADDQHFPARARMSAMEAKVSNVAAPLPIEAGKISVTVTVSGSVQLK